MKANLNESVRNSWDSAVKLGVINGASDLEIIYHNKLIFVELKVNRDTQRKSQKDFQKYVEGFGLEYVIIKSLNEFKDFLNDQDYKQGFQPNFANFKAN